MTRPPERVRLLRGRVDSARADLALLVDELNRRRRDAADLTLQVRRHPVAAAALAFGAAGLVAAGAIAAVRALRARRSLGRAFL